MGQCRRAEACAEPGLSGTHSVKLLWGGGCCGAMGFGRTCASVSRMSSSAGELRGPARRYRVLRLKPSRAVQYSRLQGCCCSRWGRWGPSWGRVGSEGLVGCPTSPAAPPLPTPNLPRCTSHPQHPPPSKHPSLEAFSPRFLCPRGVPKQPPKTPPGAFFPQASSQKVLLSILPGLPKRSHPKHPCGKPENLPGSKQETRQLAWSEVPHSSALWGLAPPGLSPR